jgi:outer membrane protein OmpA-like peptidoglycan-associated protein
LLLTSCVAKKKYTEAQTKISQLEQKNADCVAKTESLNSNISGLEQKNNELQGRYDSSMRAYSTQQTTMNTYTGYYEKQKSSADQLHTTLHQQLDEKIGANNIVLHNNKVYITLPEVTLFNSGSTTLSTKGKDIINALAANIAQNPDVEVYVATLATDPATGLALADNTDMDNTSVSADASSSNYNANAKSTYKKPAAKKKSTSSYAANTSTKTSNGTKYKSESTKKTMKSNYAKKTAKPGSSSSSMAVARASTIVSTLRQQGVQKAGIQVTDPTNRTSTSARKYQVIVSPTMEGYHEMMGKGDLGTGMK